MKQVPQWEIKLRVDAVNEDGEPFDKPDAWDWTELVGPHTTLVGFYRAPDRAEGEEAD